MSRLYDVLEHIIEKVNKSVRFEEGQVLTDAEKQIVLTNLGLTNIAPETPAPSPEETITTEYVYTYDGDTNSEEHSWVTNYGNIRVFAKMGDIPTGNLNLIGATVFRTNPSNQWLDKTFTITQEHLDKVLNKAETDIPAEGQTRSNATYKYIKIVKYSS